MLEENSLRKDSQAKKILEPVKYMHNNHITTGHGLIQNRMKLINPRSGQIQI